jgi:hypothetical protein
MYIATTKCSLKGITTEYTETKTRIKLEPTHKNDPLNPIHRTSHEVFEPCFVTRDASEAGEEVERSGGVGIAEGRAGGRSENGLVGMSDGASRAVY